MKQSVPHMLPEARERVVELVAQGQYIKAIKRVREVTGLGLQEAKDYVDGLKGEAYARAVTPDVQSKARGLIAEGRVKDAVKVVRKETPLDRMGAKDYVDALRKGRLPTDSPGTLSDRVRAFKEAGDYESAIALVRAETGMGRDEARRFVDVLQ